MGNCLNKQSSDDEEDASLLSTETRCPECGLQVADRFLDERFMNWIKANLCLQYTKEGLEKFVDTTSAEFYEGVKALISDAVKCTVCESDDMTSRSKNCRKCKALVKKIEFSCRTRTPTWKNTNLKEMQASYNNVAKLFMPPQCSKYFNPKQGDNTALLSFMEVCVHSEIHNIDAVTAVRKSRNEVSHSGTLRMDTVQLGDIKQTCVTLLKDQTLAKYSDCRHAVEEIEKIFGNSMKINCIKMESKAIDDHIRHVEGELKGLQVVVESPESKLTDIQEATLQIKKIERVLIRNTTTFKLLGLNSDQVHSLKGIATASFKQGIEVNRTITVNKKYDDWIALNATQPNASRKPEENMTITDENKPLKQQQSGEGDTKGKKEDIETKYTENKNETLNLLDKSVAGLKNLRSNENDDEYTDIPTAKTEVNIEGSVDAVKVSENILLNGISDSINKTDDPNVDASLKNAIKDYQDNLKENGAIVTSAEHGSIVINLKCSTVLDLHDMLSLFRTNENNYRLHRVEEVLSNLVRQQLQVNQVLPGETIEMLSNWIEKMNTLKPKNARHDSEMTDFRTPFGSSDDEEDASLLSTETRCPKCGLQVADRFLDERFINWIKASLCLQYTKEGLEKFVDTTSAEFYEGVKALISDAVNCTVCESDDMIKRSKKCRKCMTLVTKITNSCRTRTPTWKNTNLKEMQASYNNVAKLFMPPQCSKYFNPKQGDNTALLSFIEVCVHSDLHNIEAVTAVRKSRNEVSHSGTLRMDTGQLGDIKQTCVTLLKDQTLAEYPDCRHAVKEIEKVFGNSMKINCVRMESKAIDEHFKHVEGELKGLKVVVESPESKLTEIQEATLQIKKIVRVLIRNTTTFKLLGLNSDQVHSLKGIATASFNQGIEVNRTMTVNKKYDDWIALNATQPNASRKPEENMTITDENKPLKQQQSGEGDTKGKMTDDRTPFVGDVDIIPIPQKENPGIEFEEVLNHTVLKRVEKKYEVTIKICGEGSRKYGRYGQPDLHPDKPLHAYITSNAEENRRRAVEYIECIIEEEIEDKYDYVRV